ncbi:MAG: hypothetical protein K6A98_05755 [Prevotella sp.]|nr:hypothetical protein [Prevotella sp.]
MTENEKTLNTFATRVRQMILHYNDVKKENNSLAATIKEREKEIKQLKAQLKQSQDNYETLKMAKMVELSDGDMEAAQKRITKLIRDVNKCITLLSEK